jgi:nucleotide-binding universal stress UspA family protein
VHTHHDHVDCDKRTRSNYSAQRSVAGAQTLLRRLLNIAYVSMRPRGSMRPMDEIDRQARRWSRQQLRSVVGRAAKAGVRVVGLLREGEPAREILRVTRSKRVDFLVVGTHGRTGLGKMFLGSIASRLVATATCPVVTVRSK